MDQQSIIAGFEDRARALRLPIIEVCKRANVHPTTFSRWKLSERNPSPISATLKSIGAIDEVLREAEARDCPPADANRHGWLPSEAEIEALPLPDRDTRVVLCDTCERRLDGRRTCTFVDCPHPGDQRAEAGLDHTESKPVGDPVDLDAAKALPRRKRAA